MDIELLRTELVEAFQNKWSLNDKAHRQEHFDAVFATGVHINNVLKLDYDPKLILYAAYFHDMFAWSRVNHHELSYLWVKTTDHPLICRLKNGERDFVAIACLEHRASFKGTFTLEFSKLINSADRGFPGDVSAMLERAIYFREVLNPDKSDLEHRASAIEHLKHKYGTGGYARYPEMYKMVFGDALEQQRSIIDKLV